MNTYFKKSTKRSAIDVERSLLTWFAIFLLFQKSC